MNTSNTFKKYTLLKKCGNAFSISSNDQTDIAENARLCIEAGTDGFAVINTLMGMAIDAETRTRSSATSAAVCRVPRSSRSHS